MPARINPKNLQEILSGTYDTSQRDIVKIINTDVFIAGSGPIGFVDLARLMPKR